MKASEFKIEEVTGKEAMIAALNGEEVVFKMEGSGIDELDMNEWSEFNKFDWNVSMLLRDESPTDIKNRIKFTFAIVHLGK